MTSSLDSILAPVRVPLPERLASERPVMTREQAVQLGQQILRMSNGDRATVSVEHVVQSTTQLSTDRIRSANDGETVRIALGVGVGREGGSYLQTNQLDARALQAFVARADLLARESLKAGLPDLELPQRDTQDTYPATPLWQERSVAALQTARETTIPPVIDILRRQQFRTSGFLGIMAKAEAVLTSDGIVAFSDETDCEVSLTGRPADGTSTGWSGAASRDWGTIDPVKLATEAAEMTKRNLKPQALEPGRRTAILGPGAVVHLMRFLALHFHGYLTRIGKTGFSKVPNAFEGAKFKEQLFDRRIKITTDPSDAEASFRPWFETGYVSHPTTWVEGGVLKRLADGVGSIAKGLPYAEQPYGFRLHGGDTSIEEMIAQCDEGVYVHRLSSLDIIDWPSGMLSGVTRDGCLFIKHGKIDRPVKNFRWLASPFFLLNNIIAMGPTHRAAYGYAPMAPGEGTGQGDNPILKTWPRRPMVVPPLMVRDFNFTALIDAV